MINLTVVIDNDEAIRKLHELQSVAKQTTSSVVTDSERVDESWNKMKNTLVGLAAGVSFASLAQKIISIRGEVQQLEVAFETMLGSKEKAETLMAEIIDLAAKTPFGLQDVSNATKMLLAYGSSAEEVADEIRMLGNIASGLSIPLNDMIYLYGTTRTQGRMFTQDLRQFMGRGIPLAEELAKQFGVTKDEVGGLVTAGRVGFEDMRQALEAMTSEGGKFNDLMDKQSQTISGQISNLEDAIYQMFNSIGESSEGVISDAISAVAWLVEHYESILVILKQLILAYGSYKAALIAVAAVEKTKAILSVAAAYYQKTKALRASTIALDLLNKAWKASPIGWIAAGIGLVVSALTSFVSWTNEAAGSAKKMKREIGELEQAERDEYAEVNRLVYSYEHLADTEEERTEILQRLNEISPDIIEGVDAQAEAIDRLRQNLVAYNEVQLQTIQLARLKGMNEEALTEVANAQTDKAANEAELERQLSELAILSTEELSEKINFAYLDQFGGYLSRINAEAIVRNRAAGALFSDEVKRQFAEEILRIANEDLAPGEMVSQIRAIRASVGEGSYALNGIDGFSLVDTQRAIDRADETIAAAEAELQRIESIMPGILERLGLESYGEGLEDTGETARTYAEAFIEAEREYLDAVRALESAQRDRTSVTEEDYEAMRQRADDATKRYRELGGVVSSSSSSQNAEAQKRAEQILRAERQMQASIEQTRIDLMEEGAEKEYAQAEYNHNRRIEQLQQQEAELRRLQNGMLTETQSELIDNLRQQVDALRLEELEQAIFGDIDEQSSAAIEHLEASRKSWNEYLEEYGTFQERLRATTIRYNEAIGAAETEGERRAIEAERDAVLAQFEVEASTWAQDLVGKTIDELNAMVDQIESQIEAKRAMFDAMESSDTAEAQALLQEIARLNAELNVLRERISNASASTRNGDWDETTQVFQNINKAATDAADGIAEFDEEIAEVLRTMAQLSSVATNLIGAIQAVGKASTAATEAISAMEKASAILAVVGAAIQAVSFLVSLFKGSDEVSKTKREFKELNDELERLRKLARIDSVDGTIFGEDAFGNFRNNIGVMRDALKDLEETQEKIRSLSTQDFFTQLDEYGTHLKHYENYIDALAGMRVKLRDRSGFAEAFGAKDEYADLVSVYPELFAGGEVSLEGLKKLQESDVWEKLSQENRDLIEELIANWDAYNNAVEATNKYLTDIFGELGANITDSLVGAFENGTNAAEAMGEAFSDVIAKMARDVAHSAFIAPLLEDAQEKIKALTASKGEGMSDEDYIKALMDIGMGLVDAGIAQQDNVNAFLGAVDEYGKAQGYDIFDGSASGQTSTTKGFQAMSQDTGDELNGRFTDIQGQVHGINEAVAFIKGLNAQQLQRVSSIDTTVAMIHNDTTLIEKHAKELYAIRDGIDKLNRNIENGLV